MPTRADTPTTPPARPSNTSPRATVAKGRRFLAESARGAAQREPAVSVAAHFLLLCAGIPSTTRMRAQSACACHLRSPAAICAKTWRFDHARLTEHGPRAVRGRGGTRRGGAEAHAEVRLHAALQGTQTQSKYLGGQAGGRAEEAGRGEDPRNDAVVVRLEAKRGAQTLS